LPKYKNNEIKTKMAAVKAQIFGLPVHKNNDIETKPVAQKMAPMQQGIGKRICPSEGMVRTTFVSRERDRNGKEKKVPILKSINYIGKGSFGTVSVKLEI
jgi:ERCC4-type nuclease